MSASHLFIPFNLCDCWFVAIVHTVIQHLNDHSFCSFLSSQLFYKVGKRVCTPWWADYSARCANANYATHKKSKNSGTDVTVCLNEEFMCRYLLVLLKIYFEGGFTCAAMFSGLLSVIVGPYLTTTKMFPAAAFSATPHPIRVVSSHIICRNIKDIKLVDRL